MSIDQRCVIFHRQFPNRRILKGVMLKLMKRAGVRMKKIEICNVPTRKEARVEEFEDKTVALDKKLYEL